MRIVKPHRRRGAAQLTKVEIMLDWLSKVAAPCVLIAAGCMLAVSACAMEEHSASAGTGTQAQTDSPLREFVVGIGDSPAKLVERNSYLRDDDLDRLGVLRLSMQDADTRVLYDDGDIKLDTCAATVNADGIEATTVDFVGIGYCKSFETDFSQALEAAGLIIRKFESNNPNARKLNEWHLNASDAQVNRLEGRKTNRSEELYQPVSIGQARERFERLIEFAKLAPKNDLDRALQSHALLGVYEGEGAIFEIEVKAAKAMGGENLSDAQDREINFSIEMGFRKKPYSGSVLR